MAHRINSVLKRLRQRVIDSLSSEEVVLPQGKKGHVVYTRKAALRKDLREHRRAAVLPDIVDISPAGSITRHMGGGTDAESVRVKRGIVEKRINLELTPDPELKHLFPKDAIKNMWLLRWGNHKTAQELGLPVTELVGDEPIIGRRRMVWREKEFGRSTAKHIFELDLKDLKRMNKSAEKTISKIIEKKIIPTDLSASNILFDVQTGESRITDSPFVVDHRLTPQDTASAINKYYSGLWSMAKNLKDKGIKCPATSQNYLDYLEQKEREWEKRVRHHD